MEAMGTPVLEPPWDLHSWCWQKCLNDYLTNCHEIWCIYSCFFLKVLPFYMLMAADILHAVAKEGKVQVRRFEGRLLSFPPICASPQTASSFCFPRLPLSVPPHTVSQVHSRRPLVPEHDSDSALPRQLVGVCTILTSEPCQSITSNFVVLNMVTMACPSIQRHQVKF